MAKSMKKYLHDRNILILLLALIRFNIRFHLLYKLLSFDVIRCSTRCYSLSLIVTRYLLSLIGIPCTLRCHSLSLVVISCHQLYHQLSLVLTRCSTRLSFYKRSKLICHVSYQGSFKFSVPFVIIGKLISLSNCFANNPNFILFKWRLKTKDSPGKCVIHATEIDRTEIRFYEDIKML